MSDPQPENDLEILHPERELTIDGRTVTVREYGFVEGLKLQARIRPLIDGFAASAEDAAGTDGMDAFERLMAEQSDLVIELVAQSCDQPAEWVRGLGDEDGQQLLLTWWAVNARFFLRRLVLRQAMREARPGEKSTPPSSTTDTDARS